MTEKSREYWFRRAAENDARNLASETAGIAKLQKAFERAEAEIMERIETFYRKYEISGEISLADARQRLTPAELTSFRREIAKLSRTATTPAEKARLEMLRKRVYISRQEALLAEIQHFATELHTQTDKTLEETLTKVYNEQSSHQQYNIEQHVGWGVRFEKLSDAQIHTLVHQGYDGRDFSSKTWYSTEQLVKNLNVLLPQQFLLGKPTQDIARELSRTMKTPRYAAETLIRTEGSHVSAQADMKVYSDAGVDTYEFLATLDGRTSEICQDMDGKHFKLAEAMAGLNLPPMHPNCRSTTLPDVDMDGYVEERLAKDDDGQYIVVPKMSYRDWQASLATRGRSASGLSGATVSWRTFDLITDRNRLLEKANKYVTGEIPADVLAAKDDPELLKKIRANAQTTFNENANRFIKANERLNDLDSENSPEGIKLKAEMDRYANKMVLYANKLKVIDAEAWKAVATPEPTQATVVSVRFKATTVQEMRQELEQTYHVGLYGDVSKRQRGMPPEPLSDALVEHVYSGIQKMYEKEPELVLKGLEKMANISMFKDLDRQRNQNTYAWVWSGPNPRMQFNGDYYYNRESFAKSYASTVSTSWHPPGGTWKSVFTHEFGHVIENAYFGTTGTNKMANAVERAWTKAKRENPGLQYIFSKVEWRGTISDYATRDLAETFAEAWTDWIDNGDLASDASKLIIAEVKKEVAKLK